MGIKRKRFTSIVLTVLIVLSFSVLLNAHAQTSTDCTSCHTKYPGDSFDKYLDTNPVPKTNCLPCHGDMKGHATAVAQTPYGWFETADSVDFAKATTISRIHTQHKATQTNLPDDYGCVSCHAGTACTTCHSPQVPHGNHTIKADNTTSYPGVNEKYSKGRGQAAYTVTIPCTNAKCHGSMNLLFTARPSCLNCHAVGQEGHGDITSKHESSEITAGCITAGCHASTNLTSEHESKGYTCDVCHKNPNPDRAATCEAAVKSNNTNCSACHVVADHRALHEAEPAATGCTGTACHNNNLADEHELRKDPNGDPYDCNVCHGPNARQEAKDAIERYKQSGRTDKATCVDCHADVPDHHNLHLYGQMDGSCQTSGCHVNYLDDEHAHRGLDCSTCHDYKGTKLDPVAVKIAIDSGDRRCVACHVGAGQHYAQHEATPRIDDPSHPYGTNFCQNCHLNNLMDEHPRHKAVDGSSLNCDTCHGVLTGPVRTAIELGNTNCDACHVIHGNIIGIHESPTTQAGNKIDGVECGQCHSSNLGTEHDKFSVGCSACHDSSNTTVLNAIENRNTTCSACHGTYHAQKDTKHTSTSTCKSCHGNNLETVHSALSCAKCHNNPTRVGDINTKTAACEGCHYEPTYPYHAQKDTKHTSTSTCKSCHGNNLETVHSALTCDTCHNNPTRVGNISTKTANCADCHYAPQYPYHTQQDSKHTAVFGAGGCNNCHAAMLTTEHEKATSTTNDGQPITCETCHVGSPSWVAKVKPWDKTCAACHPFVQTGHHDLHQYAQMQTSCQAAGCHVNWLDDEHANRGLNCNTCHDYKGTKLDPQKVKAAITNHDRSCTACHPGAGAHYEQHKASITDDQCMICHKNNLVDEHQARGLTCATCHEYVGGSLNAFDVTSAIASNNVQCGACHKYSHSDLRAEFNASYHPAFEPGANPNVSGLKSPWTSTSITKCTDCHAASSSYPVTAKDGSKVYLKASWNADGRYGVEHKDDKNSSGDALCLLCHGSMTATHGGDKLADEHDKYDCSDCHTAHGSDKRRLIAYNSGFNGWVQQSASNYDKEDCSAPCDDHHDRAVSIATIAGKVTDSTTGAGIAKAKLTANKCEIVQYADVNGNYRLGNLASGTYTITASASGVASKSQTVTVSTGQTATLNFTLGPTYKITGRVTDSASGLPIAGAVVATNTGGYSALTDSGGFYTLSDVIAGSYTVTASSSGYDSQSQTIFVTGDTTANFTLTKSVTPPPPPPSSNLALNKSVTASGYEGSSYQPSYACDGSTSTRWWKRSTSTQWLRVDLGSNMNVSKVVLNWHSYYAREYRVQVSTDGSNWTTVYSTTSGTSGSRTITFTSRTARYVRAYCTKAYSDNGYSIYEFEVYQ